MVAAGGVDRYQIAAGMGRLPLSRWHNKPLSSVLSPYLVGATLTAAPVPTT
jgi:hypothetical protein